MFANYHLPRKKDSFDLIILRSHLWGGRFEVGRKISGDWDRRRRKYRRGGQEALRPRRMDILSICGSFWLPDNSRIIADSRKW
jgi:hypothetical protein